jgi:hypothetical protein
MPPHPAIAAVDDAAPAVSRPATDGAAPATRAVVVGLDARSLEVHYEFDPIANLWVANVLDEDTGEVVRTVPAKRILHQLAEIRRQRVDARA